LDVVGAGDDLAALADALAEVFTAVGAADLTGATEATGVTGVVGTGIGLVAATVHPTEYAAGVDAAALGLLTTSSALPLAGSAGGANLNGVTVFVPAAVNVTVRVTERVPFASAQ
jgi:hypothetical protein